MEIKLLQTADELETCARLMHSTDPWITLGMDMDRCRIAFGGQVKETYMAVIAGEIAGFATLQFAGVLRGYIQTLCVAAKFRGQGIGTKLISYSEERILKECPNIFICVSSFNPGAFKLYTSLGFEKIAELKDHIVRGHDEYILRKSTMPIMEFKPKK